MTGPRVPLTTVVALAISTSLLFPHIQTLASGQQRQRSVQTPRTFGFGRPAVSDDVTRLDIDVMPDGTGLPLGGGRHRFRRGAAPRSSLVPGATVLKGRAEPLRPSRAVPPPRARPLTVGNYWPYATTLYNYTNRAMPRTSPGTLTPNQVYGLVAWILAKNKVIAEDAMMTAETLPAVLMPARNRFVPDDRRGGAELR